MANIIAPLVFGLLQTYVTRPGMPMVLSGACFGLAAIFMLFNMWLGLGVKQSLKRSGAYTGGNVE